jgi:tetratricopeptide (TPR) repeat protein
MALPAGAAVLKGVVVKDEVGGPTVANVVITSPGANRTVTLSDGQFRLDFPGEKPGESVNVFVNKLGYVVVNDVQLAETLPINPDTKPLLIVICRAADREEMARRFYGLESRKAVAERFNQLRKTQGLSAEGEAELRHERDEADALANKLAEELAKTRPGQASDLYMTAMRLFLDEKPQEALALLSEDKLRALSSQAEHTKREAENEIENVTQVWLLRAGFLTTQFEFEGAEDAYRAAIDTSPDSFAATVRFARFNQELNRNAQALDLYRRCLELAKRSGKQEDVAVTLNNLGVLHAGQNQMDEARKDYEQALQIYGKLTDQKPDAYAADVARALTNLGSLNVLQNRTTEAQQDYDKAIEAYRRLAENNQGYLPALALSLIDLGVLEFDRNLVDEAEKTDTEALTIYSRLSANNPGNYSNYVAAVLTNLALLNSARNKVDEARQGHEKALTIYRELAKENPETYTPYVGRTLSNLGLLNAQVDDERRMREARMEDSEALEIFRELSEKNPQTYAPLLAGTLINLGILDRRDNRLDEARDEYGKALTTFSQLAKENGATYSPYVAMVLTDLGNVDRSQGQIEQARKEYQQALDIYQRFAEQNPDQFKPLVEKLQHLLSGLVN